MRRYIDSEKFDCVAFKGIPDGYKDTFADGLLYALNRIDEEPTVDAVKVVRCKDCKYLNESLAVGGWDGSCKYWNTHSTVYSGFCSYGERREVTK